MINPILPHYIFKDSEDSMKRYYFKNYQVIFIVAKDIALW